jgi:MFS family permease
MGEEHYTMATVRPDRYKWVALSNATLGVLMGSIDTSITLIAMPDIFRGIRLNPLLPANSVYLLWMMLGFAVATSVLVVNFGRLGDIYGRVKLYNLGFAVYTFFSLMLTITWQTGQGGALYLDVMRIFQGVGAALLFSQSGAIITDAFPSNQRGLALGINNIAGISGTFIGLVLGGLLAPIDWRLVFLISVPIGLFGTVWAYMKLEERGERRPSKLDWWGNVTFALGLIGVMVGITYGIEPYGKDPTGWMSPLVLASLTGGVALLFLFVYIEKNIDHPMFRLRLFRIRAFTGGSISTLLSGVARGGLMFMLVIWLQGIWLPEHGYSFARTPFVAGIYVLPLTFGFLVAGPLSGYFSDRVGPRPLATMGMIGQACAFGLLLAVPIDFSYPVFALVLFFFGLCQGAFLAPNRAGVMNSLPAQHRGAGGAMNTTFQNASQVLSIGIFFSLMIAGLSSSLPRSFATKLGALGVPSAAISQVSHLPPVAVIFAAFLGYNPMRELLGPSVLAKLPPAKVAIITGREFFPHIITEPFRNGLHEAFIFAIVICLIAAVISWSRGKLPAH